MRKFLGLFLLFQMASAQSNLRGPASTHLLDHTIPPVFEMKKATFEDCNKEVAKQKASAKFNFLDQCITFASSNLQKGSDPRVCLATARLAASDDVRILVKRCQSELGYDLCKVDTPKADVKGLLDCIHKYKDSMDVADCGPDIQEIKKVMGVAKVVIKLTQNQESVLQKGYCQRPAQALPPSVRPAAPGQK